MFLKFPACSFFNAGVVDLSLQVRPKNQCFSKVLPKKRLGAIYHASYV